jgi:hypothetical protein
MITERVCIADQVCPSCGSPDLARGIKTTSPNIQVPRPKRLFDLTKTASGIRRRVIECRSSVHRCQRCGVMFVPEQYRRMDKHLHGLKSWCVYQHVAHRIKYAMIEEMCEEYFGLGIYETEIRTFKSSLARYYEPTYRRLLEKILLGTVMHVDETTVKLRKAEGKHYVWVFTNLEEVVFMYKPTREGGFLQTLLAGFGGVLVSDFYAVYDSLPCPQQKCLIHLIRDMNQDLLDNAYDEELRSVTQPFGALLRAIVETIDQQGLKYRYLRRHQLDVDRYFQSLSVKSFSSEAAESLRCRLLKYQDKLFTFLVHDGVPWNNNNAENAIKRFAYYRADTVGLMTEPTLNDYLVMLSLYQTCRYKGVSFLRFLLSREQDVDTFCQHRRRRHRPSPIETYPDGFTPSHRISRPKMATESNATSD